MHHTDVIAALGGPEVLAASLGKDRSSVYRWRHHGIPVRHWAEVVGLAKAAGETGITLTKLAEGVALVRRGVEAA